MGIVAPPPAIYAPQRPCADYSPVNLHISYTTLALSPDCKWQVISWGDDFNSETQKRMAQDLPKEILAGHYRAFVIERASGKIIYHFDMERSASLHWLKDNHHLMVNYFAGSGSSLPLIFHLKSRPVGKPVDLGARVFPDVLRRAGISDRHPYGSNTSVYHYYATYIEDAGASIIISAQPDYVLGGREGPGTGRCYLYRVSKATFRYHFMRQVDPDNCPGNADEKWQ